MITRSITSAEDMEQLGSRLASVLHAGDVVVLNGGLGAGKTTFTRGVGEGLGVIGTIQSPTFVVARTHARIDATAPALVHVDAYRLSDARELVDLDIDYDNSIVIIEWGRPYVAQVADQWLTIDIHPLERPVPHDSVGDDERTRVVTMTGHARSGAVSTRWQPVVEAFDDSRH